MEQLKLNPEDFGGFQTRMLTVEEAGQRYCARVGCADRGRIQMMIPGEGGRMFRVLCGRHFIMIMIIQAAVMGDPSPIGEGRRLADKMKIPWENIPDLNVPQVVNFGTAICERCGGGAMMETVGMYAGCRWIHTCITEDEKNARRPG